MPSKVSEDSFLSNESVLDGKKRAGYLAGHNGGDTMSGNSGNAGAKYRRKQRAGGYQTSSYSPAGRFGKR